MKTAKKKVVKKAKLEAMVNDAPRHLDDASWPVGSVAWQGDIGFVRVEKMPECNVRSSSQLADGNTQGSRHICEIGNVFDATKPQDVTTLIKKVCPRADVQPQYIGPMFKTVDGVALVTHPEHGDYHFHGDMCIAVVVQRNLDAEEREVRSRD